LPSALPDFPFQDFHRAVESCSPDPLSETAYRYLYAHYQELVRWNRTLSLVGPGTAGEVISRHYGESLAALPFLPEEGELVDLGSGGGFPGLVIAAARPRLSVTLVEAQERKWAFLLAAARRAGLSCRCLNARVALPLPADLPAAIDRVTVRALKLDSQVLGALADRLRPAGGILLWAGDELPDLPGTLTVTSERRLPGSLRRRIVELSRTR